MTNNNQPPIGLMPKSIWDALQMKARLAEIDAAVQRYTEAQMPIPQEWLLEQYEIKRRIEL